MSGDCDVCQLPDPYNGGGDGIGSCDCLRCEGGCGYPAGSDFCTCPDDEYDPDSWESQPEEELDWPDIARWHWSDPDTGRVLAHPYEYAGTVDTARCWCGRPRIHRLHAGHGVRRAWRTLTDRLRRYR